MITFTKAFTVGVQTFATLELAQEYELIALLKAESGGDQVTVATAAQLLVGNKAKVLDILTTTAKSRPSARKVNGATRRRKPKETLTPTPIPTPI